MLGQLIETVQLEMPATPVLKDPYTDQDVAPAASTVTDIEVVWGASPQKRLVVDKANGHVMGVADAGDASMIYEGTEFDFSVLIKRGVLIRRQGSNYEAMGFSVFHGRQVVILELRQPGGAQ